MCLCAHTFGHSVHRQRRLYARCMAFERARKNTELCVVAIVTDELNNEKSTQVEICGANDAFIQCSVIHWQFQRQQRRNATTSSAIILFLLFRIWQVCELRNVINLYDSVDPRAYTHIQAWVWVNSARSNICLYYEHPILLNDNERIINVKFELYYLVTNFHPDLITILKL